MSEEFYKNIMSANAVRQTTGLIYKEIINGGGHWKVNIDKLDQCADSVCEVIKTNYTTLDIP